MLPAAGSIPDDPVDEEGESYPGYLDEDEDTDCFGPDDPDDWESEADEPEKDE